MRVGWKWGSGGGTVYVCNTMSSPDAFTHNRLLKSTHICICGKVGS